MQFRGPLDLRGVVGAFLAAVRPSVEQSAGGAGCAVAAVATEADQGSPPALAARDALRRWDHELTARLLAVGASPERAAALSSLLLTTLEGAHVLCRAEGSVQPFDAASTALLELAEGHPSDVLPAHGAATVPFQE